MTGRPARTPDEMLAYLREHVYIDGDCLIWAGPFHTGGAPRISWNYRSYLARRLLLELSGRRIRTGEVVYDICDDARCMAEDHLRVGTRAMMAKQRAKQDRYLAGAQRSRVAALGRAGGARLGIDRAPEVLQLRAAGWSYRRIGERYGVHPSAVGHAIAAWKRAGVGEWWAA